MEKKIFGNDHGFIMENKAEGYIKIMVRSVKNFDGIIGDHHNETRINYESGLFQEWIATGYYVNFRDWCKDKTEAINYGKRMLKAC